MNGSSDHKTIKQEQPKRWIRGEANQYFFFRSQSHLPTNFRPDLVNSDTGFSPECPLYLRSSVIRVYSYLFVSICGCPPDLAHRPPQPALTQRAPPAFIIPEPA